MKLITQRDLIRERIALAKIIEPRNRSRGFKLLMLLDPETATAEAVTEIENSDYWVTSKCDECGRRAKECVEIGEEFEDCEQCSIAVCRDCLEKALDLIDQKRLSVRKPCPNCRETIRPCACLRNKCRECGKPVGNITFTYCDECFEESKNSQAGSRHA